MAENPIASEVAGVLTQQMDAARLQVLQLLNAQIDGVLLPLLSTSNLFNNEDGQQHNLSSELLRQWHAVLQGERYKAERLEASFVVVGTMKAGKSTTINTIVGSELLPNRNQPMTTLPTVIRHHPGKKDPELFFPNPAPFNALIVQLKEVLEALQSQGDLNRLPFCVTADGKELVQKIMNASLEMFQEKYKGQQEIFCFLKNINDIWRLCISDGVAIDVDDCLRHYNDIQAFPAIEVEFAHLSSQPHLPYDGKFALVDTPGGNEAGQTYLKAIVREQLGKASAVVAILDYTQLNAEAEADVRRALDEVSNITGGRLFVLVNKFDQKDRHSMDADALRAYVSQQLFEGRLPSAHIFPVSSRYGYLASSALRELRRYSRLPDYQFNPWVGDFYDLALGASWDEEACEDSIELEKRARMLWRSSRFDRPLAEVIKNGCINAAGMSLQAALDKMVTYNTRVIDSLQLRKSALVADAATIEDNIKALAEKLAFVAGAEEEARRLIDACSERLQNNIFQLFDEIDQLVADEIELVFQRESWIAQRLAPYIDSGRQNAAGNASHYLCNDFTSKADADKFIDKLVAAGAESIEPRLQKMQTMIEVAANKEIADVWTGVNSRLTDALQATEKKLKESFSVTMDLPKPCVATALKVDFNQLHQSSIRKDAVTRMDTKQERKWYTLWCRKQTVVHKYQEHVYRVYTKDVVGQIQTQIKKDTDFLWESLAGYVRNTFTPALDQCFIDAANGLKWATGDLSAAMQDKKMQNERIAGLMVALADLLSEAQQQQESLQAAADMLYANAEMEVGGDLAK